MSIVIRHIAKRFGEHVAVDDLSLSVEPGELVALLGPSGSGKTTLLRIIAGLEQPEPHPDAGIRFAGEEVLGRPVGRRRVGFVFQHYALFRHMTVFENIAFGLRVRPRRARPSNTAITARVRELLALIQLEEFGGRLPSELSGGQRQRVALARALAVQPSVLLLDEPFGALDAKVRAELRRWLRRLHDDLPVASLFVTHDQEEALEVADRVVIMRAGRIEQDGTPDEVFHHPANAFVADFLGKVNLFSGRVEAGRAVFGPLSVEAPRGADGEPARLMVRPHELRLDRDPSPGALRATVTRVQSAGSIVTVELAGEDGTPVAVELTHERHRELAATPGDALWVSVRQSRVYIDDWSI